MLHRRLITFIVCFFSIIYSSNAQNPEWLIYTMGKTMTRFVDDGTYLWIGSEGGLIRRNKIDNSMMRYNRANSPLPDNWVRDIVIDDNGNKWMATNTGGLVKFDGSNWSVYNTQNSGIVDNCLCAVEVDNSGKIWIGSRSMGISVFDGTSWITYNKTNSGLQSDYILEITIDEQNIAWIGAGNHGLYKFNGSTWINYTYGANGLPGWYVKCIVIDDNNIKWIGTEGGLSKYDDVSFVSYTQFNSGISWKDVNCIAINNNGLMWIGTTAGLNKFDGTNWTRYYDTEIGTDDDDITAIEVEDNHILFSVAREGIIKFDGNSVFQTLPFPFDGPVKNLVNDIAFDAQGNPWFASNYALMHFDGVQWFNYTPDNSGIPDSEIVDIEIDDDGVVWMGTRGSGVTRFSNGHVTNFNASDSRLPNNYIYSLKIDHNGFVWVGTGDGYICKFDGVNWTTFDHTITGIQENERITAIAIDDNNTKWFGPYFYSGLITYDDVNWNYLTGSSGFNDMKFDNEGNLWCATGSILKKYSNGIWTLAPEGIPTGDKKSVDIDYNGNIWLASFLTGAVKLENGVWTSYNYSNSPIASQYTKCIAIDGKGNKWIGAQAVEDGISVYNENGVMVDVKSEPLTKFQTVSVFPNPAGSCFFIPETIEKEVRGVQLINMQGKIVLNQSYQNQKSIDISFLPPGFYISRFITDHQLYSCKLLKVM